MCVFYHLGLAYADTLRYGYHIWFQIILLLARLPTLRFMHEGTPNPTAEFLLPSSFLLPQRNMTLGRFH